MSVISIKHVSKTFGEHEVLKDLSLELNFDDKLALIGENGVGKTTLFKLILGTEKPDIDSGSIHVAPGAVIGYMEQHQHSSSSHHALLDEEVLSLEHAINRLNQRLALATDVETPALLAELNQLNERFEALDGYSFQARLAQILDGLGLNQDTMHRPLSELSGGELMRAHLARVLVREPDILLLDEPTNHLDQFACEWLQQFLQKYKGVLLVISHDRAFIDSFANITGKLAGGKLVCQRGNYSHFAEIEAEQAIRLAKEVAQLEKQLQRQEEITQTMLSHRKISSYHSSEKKVTKLKETLAQVKSQKRQSDKQLHFQVVKGNNTSDPDRILCQLKDLQVTFTGRNKPLFCCPELTVRGQDHIVVVGPNGAGKTTFIKSILGQLPDETSGTLAFAHNLKIGYLGQNIRFADENTDVLTETMRLNEGMTEGQARNLLAKFGFTGESVYKHIYVLSGGERARLYLCSLLQENPDLLILDEPTNHLDINSREILEQALQNYDGALIAISHDLYFIRKIAQKILGFVGEKLLPFTSYEQYRQKVMQLKQTAGNLSTLKIPTSSGTSESIREDKKEQATNNADPLNAVAEILFTDAEIAAYPQLAEFKTIPSNRSQAKRFTAHLRQLSNTLEQQLTEREAQAEQLEKQFQTANNPELYAEYATLLETIQLEENLYLKILEILENC